MLENKEDQILKFKWALQALSINASEQLKLFPDFVCPGDELVLNFDEHYTTVKNLISFTTFQTKAVNNLINFLDLHSGAKYEEMYLTAEGLLDCNWDTIRFLAASALSSFNWTSELPPHDTFGVYVNSARPEEK